MSKQWAVNEAVKGLADLFGRKFDESEARRVLLEMAGEVENWARSEARQKALAEAQEAFYVDRWQSDVGDRVAEFMGLLTDVMPYKDVWTLAMLAPLSEPSQVEVDLAETLRDADVESARELQASMTPKSQASAYPGRSVSRRKDNMGAFALGFFLGGAL